MSSARPTFFGYTCRHLRFRACVFLILLFNWLPGLGPWGALSDLLAELSGMSQGGPLPRTERFDSFGRLSS